MQKPKGKTNSDYRNRRMVKYIDEYKKAISSREVGVKEALQAFLCVAHKNANNEFITVSKEEYIEEKVLESQKRFDSGNPRPLEGVPVAIKDNICTRGLRTTAGSKILSNFVPGYTAEVVDRLENAGAIVVGKANMDEFGMGGTTENSAYGICTNSMPNPITGEMNLSPGGSSGGSAVSVASGSSICSLGTDTGGSVRQPAMLCGLYGMKPTYGAVSRHGVAAYASSFDQVGPIANSAKDLALVCDEIYGFDEKDSTTVKDCKSLVGSISNRIGQSVKGLTVATLSGNLLEGVNEEIVGKIDEALGLCKSLGMEVKSSANLRYFNIAPSIYYSVTTTESFSNLARYDGIRYGYNRWFNTEDESSIYKVNRTEGFGKEVQKRVAVGAMNSSEENYEKYFLQGTKVRRMLATEMIEALNQVDVVIMPVDSTFGHLLGQQEKVKTLDLCLSDKFTFPASCGGFPSISVPFGKSKSGFHIGLQIISNHFKDSLLIQIADAIESALK